MDKRTETFSTRVTLLERIQHRNDDKSWEEFVYYYQSFIYLICCRMGMSHLEADEVVQRVLIKLWKKLPDFEYDERQRFRSWLCRVIQNEGRDYYRGLARKSRLKEDMKQFETWSSNHFLPEVELVADREWNDYVASLALDRIRPHFSAKSIEVFLRLAKGENPRDIERELGLSENAAYVYRKRVRDHLKREVQQLYNELL